ncbi:MULTISPECIES: trypsin-like serine peptidase [Streptomyces]|uniref:Serine protease n=1 Tax=Streptomyces griseoaurantiacus TaxID=68213 RepID=A0ABZ1V8L8_9ACTN|nr:MULTISPECIES: trypsin-like serine protease [Streptomyces]MDX3088247.1 trypsin-like serine protease [Streptomyces sp. ME12-02E]MDX3331578.1 trypsin-like serine protease [Streptomyces sp. ME02-6978a]
MDAQRTTYIKPDQPVGGSGSGYLIGPRLVLTALHVVHDDGVRASGATVWVGHPRADSGLRKRTATVIWPAPDLDPDSAGVPDVALLLLDQDADEGHTTAVPWGRPQGDAPLAYAGIGVPAFSTLSGGGVQYESLRGELAPLTTAGRRWVLDCRVWPAATQQKERPWAGASGTAIFTNGHLVGVAVEYGTGMGERRLTAEPIYLLLTDPGFTTLLTEHGFPSTRNTADDVTADEATATRSRHAWSVLAEQRKLATSGVRTAIGDESSGGPVVISFADRREQLAEALREAGTRASALLVSGESGIGKSALTLSAVAELEAVDPAGFQGVVVNFRSLPQSSLELRAALGMSLEDVLAEASAPSRVLVIDAADAALERSAGLLSDLVLAAAAAGVGLVAVTSDVALGYVREQVELGFAKSVSSFEMSPLGDEDISVVSGHFQLLRAVLRDLPANSLLRRPVVLDLLARTGTEPDSALGEWECLDLVWSRVVRGDGRPGVGSAEAREQTLLAVAAATMKLPEGHRPLAGVDAAAVDALRRDHLLAPASRYRNQPDFAHDEVRRYATAILLVRSQSPTELLQAAGAPRWALSAATLACKGLLKAPDTRPVRMFIELHSRLQVFAVAHGPRWSDVPVEAVLETPFAYECLKSACEDQSVDLVLGDVVRVVQQRHKVNGLVDHLITNPVVQILLDEKKPWDVSEESFELLADWLQALSLANIPAGDELRIRLRGRLLAYWNSFSLRKTGADVPSGRILQRRRRRRELDYHLTRENFVETLALLGPDIDDAIEACLRAIADDAPAFLAPAADAPLSARALAQKDPELLAALMMAYYIDDETSWHRDEGVRGHQGRWRGFGVPFFQYYFGGFWQLFQTASVPTSVRVLNGILNSGARARVAMLSRPSPPYVFTDPFDGGGEGADGEAENGEGEDRGAILNIHGTSRLYVGDSHVWSWYRGTSVGPYSAMSALQAMERLADMWLSQGVSTKRVVEVLLHGCENLAVPGMLFGLLARHIEKVGTELDLFLAEPVVWDLEFGRTTSEYSGLRATTEGLANLERRRWTPREVAMWLMVHGGQGRVQDLKKVAKQLVENGDRLGYSQELTKNWAASLDSDQYRVKQHGDAVHIEVEPPPELRAAQEAHTAYQEALQTSTRLKNRYWGSVKHDTEYVPPPSAEIAADLAAGRALLESDGDQMPPRDLDAVAHVTRAAIERAAAGDMEALGDEAQFATDLVIGIALSFQETEGQHHEGQFFDLGADRAVAQAVPAFLTPALAAPLEAAGGSIEDVAEAGLAMAGKAPMETRLYLARGCDVVWRGPCHFNPCIHPTALNWLLETARGAEIGPWDQSGQRRPNIQIAGDVAERLQELPGDSVRIAVLDAAIRGLGAAASTDHCCTDEAAALLAALLDVERRAMVVQESEGWSADDRGTHTLIAARALLEGFAKNGDIRPLLEHLDALRAGAQLMSNFLHGLAAAGAENDRLAEAARGVWPSLLRHAIGYLSDDPSPYRDHHWGDWAAAALLPDPLPWTQGLYNEVVGEPIDWVRADDLVEVIDDWLPAARGEVKPVDALISILRKLPEEVQVTRGVPWVSDLCIQDGRVTVKQSWFSDSWLKEIRTTAEELGKLDEWQMLVDSLVVAGNEGLAPYSR